MPKKRDQAITPCASDPRFGELMSLYAADLKKAAPSIGSHGLTEEAFWDSGLFHGAIERLRGEQAAAMSAKRSFVSGVLEYLREKELILSWLSAGGGDRHDYEVTMPDGIICAIEAKGCLDGNNTNIYQRPSNADEFVVWSLCQNPGADPRHNAWSGIHTRLSAEMVHGRDLIDGLIIWDELCGGLARPCPKLQASASRITLVGARSLPPPCIYLFPRTVPDPRNNPNPPVHKLSEVKFLDVLHRAFQCDAGDVTEVHIQAAMFGTAVARSTRLVRNGEEIAASQMTPIRRAKS